MAITTQAQQIAALKGGQQLHFSKTAGGTSQAAGKWGGYFPIAGDPPAGTLAGTSTTAGVVPTDATVGCPTIYNFAAGATGYLGAVAFTPTATAAVNNGYRYRLCDMLWKGGGYAFNAAVTVTSPPSYSGRIPNGDYKGTEIWIEALAAFTGTPTFTIVYTNQDGLAGQTATLTGGLTNAVSNLVQVPLAAGDTGVQKIESVTATVATAGGPFNVLVLRPLWCGHIVAFGGDGANGDLIHGPDLTGMPILFDSSALILQAMNCAGSQMTTFDAMFTIING